MIKVFASTKFANRSKVGVALFFVIAFPLQAQLQFTLKSAPSDVSVFLNGKAVNPVSVSTAQGLRNYRLVENGIVRFSAAGYTSLEYPSNALPIKSGLVEIKLENENGALELLGEYPTGRQPKSAYFSPDGQRLFVPLLDQHGVDVFRVTGSALGFEKTADGTWL